jgi:hypothetical protein
MLVTLAIYWPAGRFDFVQYDDDEYVFDNQTVRSGLTWYGVAWAFADSHAANWHPLSWISHMVDCQLFGLNPSAHHLENVLLHCSNTVLLFLVLQTMTGTFWRSALVAGLFAWHPLRVESVAWVSERKDVLSGFFFFLTLLTYAKFVKSKVQSPKSEAKSHPPFSILNGRSSRCYWLSVCFFGLGLLAKPMLVTVPFVLLLLDFWPLRRFGFSAQKPSSIKHPDSGIEYPVPTTLNLVREKIPFFLLSLSVILITPFAQNAGGAVVSLESEGITARLEIALAGYARYLAKIMWPHDLSFLYLRPPAVPPLTLIVAALVLLVISALVFHWIRPTLNCSTDGQLPPKTGYRRLYLAVGWLWFLGMMLPVSGLAQTGLHAITDRYTYLPSIGLEIMAVWGVGEMAATFLPFRASGPAIVAASVVVLVVCAALTRHQLTYWQNTETLMEHALQIDPNNYVAHQNLGVYYTKLGRTEAAREHRERFRELQPSF